MTFGIAQGGGHGHGRGIGASPAQRGQPTGVGAPLKARHDQHVIPFQLASQKIGVDGQDARAAVGVVGADGQLVAEQGTGVDARVAQQHGEQRHGLLLACGQQHVQFGRVGLVGPLVGHLQQFVGLPVAGGQDHNHLAALAPGGQHLGAHLFHALQIGNGGAPEFLHQNTHG